MRLLPTLLIAAASLTACRYFTPAEFFAENYTPWHYVQQPPSGFTTRDLDALGIAADMKFTDKDDGDIIYVFRLHHTPYYQGEPDKELAEVWRFDANTKRAVGIYTYRYNKIF